jgi:hypothetical protein
MVPNSFVDTKHVRNSMKSPWMGDLPPLNRSKVMFRNRTGLRGAGQTFSPQPDPAMRSVARIINRGWRNNHS